MDNEPHPWQIFLEARAKVIMWMKNELKYTDEQISHNLSMDKIQVRLIREYLETNG